MTSDSKILEILSSPREIEGGDVVRVVSDAGKVRSERWNRTAWETFPALDMGALWHSRELSAEELRNRGITLRRRGDEPA